MIEGHDVVAQARICSALCGPLHRRSQPILRLNRRGLKSSKSQLNSKCVRSRRLVAAAASSGAPGSADPSKNDSIEQQTAQDASDVSTSGREAGEHMSNGSRRAGRVRSAMSPLDAQLPLTFQAGEGSDSRSWHYKQRAEKQALLGTLLKVIGTVVLEVRSLGRGVTELLHFVPQAFSLLGAFLQEVFSELPSLAYPKPRAILRMTSAVLLTSAALTLLVYGLNSAFAKLLMSPPGWNPGLLKLGRFAIMALLVVIVTPQTATENAMLRWFHKSGVFRNYGEAKMVLTRLTWSLIALYIGLTFVASK